MNTPTEWDIPEPTPRIEVEFGKPQTWLPEAQKPRDGGASHWRQIAEFAKRNPGLWCPVKLTGTSYKNLRNATMKIQKGLLVAFSGDAWSAAVRDRILWVRYDGTQRPNAWDLELR